jgi:hypothetical protein
MHILKLIVKSWKLNARVYNLIESKWIESSEFYAFKKNCSILRATIFYTKIILKNHFESKKLRQKWKYEKKLSQPSIKNNMNVCISF